MTNPHVRTMRRAGGAAVLAATLALSLTACGSDDGNKPKDAASQASTSPSKSDKGNGGGETVPDTSKTLATVKGEKGIDMVVHVAKRDDGGFLTLTGEFKNTSGSRVVTPVQWSGTEEAVARTGPSLAAMTLVDSQEKKRYYVLRDTDNRPLTTTSYDSGIDAGKSLPFFAQFPAPAQSTTKVDLQFPGFTTATIEIS
ncbi:hypothetical protein [Streptomyces sp. NBC_00338]|uniref:hypothetical protein n=1 Tax=unclassified Streptomyces TaxID=2593676 RepID=UPI002250DE89|nr:hypothetical protein [Streptomyces sp. NBC_00338]MCX5142543.1 hypothetical protein [Streptomyces sp. NBC_00338]WSU60998.1 hypothetical protein OG450_25545 [Streptomyces sp. NBC_01104]